MADNFDVSQWIGGLELTDEQKATMQAALTGEKNQQVLRESFLRQQDYSRKMNEAARFKAEQEAAYSRQFQDLAAWKQTAESTLSGAESARLKAEAEAKALRAAAETYGLDTSTIPIPDVPTQPNQNAVAAPQKPDAFKEFETRVSAEISSAPLVQAAMLDIASSMRS
jgi:hypothetical protein